MKKKIKYKNIAIYTIIIFALVFGIIPKQDAIKMINKFDLNNANISYSNNDNDTVKNENTNQELYKVVSVVDGDTFKIIYNQKEEKVRLIGIDTPESVHADKSKNTKYGKIASEYVKELLKSQNVKLEFDVSSKDKYGRLLAYVYLENGEMLNEKLLKEGYAQMATYPPNVKYVENFKKMQKQARENKVGFWKEDAF